MIVLHRLVGAGPAAHLPAVLAAPHRAEPGAICPAAAGAAHRTPPGRPCPAAVPFDDQALFDLPTLVWRSGSRAAREDDARLSARSGFGCCASCR
ncbi:hypothetical protein ACFXAZ_38890 [Streptomyces sp. NPDC059477]|uniref:hypothetical protein n=1 Tax=Streptomyces sp. NPDC059477 TaxID=3346847 RepID=UPI00367E63A9